jgi:WD40 repeat protein
MSASAISYTDFPAKICCDWNLTTFKCVFLYGLDGCFAGFDLRIWFFTHNLAMAATAAPVLQTQARVLEGHFGCVSSVAFSPDGHHVVSDSFDNMVRFWDAANGECLRVLRGHAGGVSSVAVSPDGLVLASSSLDGTVRVWDTTNWVCLRVLSGELNLSTRWRFRPTARS